MKLDHEIDLLIDRSLQEDLHNGDITSEACIPSQALCTGFFFLKQSGVIAGLLFLKEIFKRIDPSIEIVFNVEEGSYQKTGTVIATLKGSLRSILSAERTALNMLQHVSGVASMTYQHVQKVKGTNCAILDTRKTLPGLRALEKYAVRIGGGQNHRFSLGDRFIIKHTHLNYIRKEAKNPIEEAIKHVKEHRKELPIEVEVNSLEQFEEAIKHDIETIMLYNLAPQEVKTCVKKAKNTNKKIYFESSVQFTFDSILEYAKTGIDGISISALTYSCPPLDIGFKLNKEEKITEKKAPESRGSKAKNFVTDLLKKPFASKSKEKSTKK